VRYYPVFLDLAGQLCIVLGDGKFAVEKAAALREAGANVRVISSRDYRPGVLAGARLVVDASEDLEINRQSWQEAEAAGILINVVDRPAQCRFIAPAIVRRDPLLVAISTSGESPFLASALRARIERSSRRARQQAWQWRATVGGLATASLLVAVLVGPRAVHVTDNTYGEIEPVSFYRQTDRAETQQEQARLNSLRRNAASSSTQWVGAVMRPASASRWHPVEDEGGAAKPTPTEAPRSQSAGIRPI